MNENGYQINDQTKVHFITATVVDWVDAFSRKIYKDIVIESLDYCIKNKGMILYGYIIMTNHIHLVVQSETGKLFDLLRDFKKFTARNILDTIELVPESRKDLDVKKIRICL